jgi:hypothetical protein
VSAGEGRTVAELLDDSDGLAREELLDMSADRALGMVRGWPQLMQSAADLWTALPPDPTVSASTDPIAILAAMGRSVDRGLTAEHWPGRGPSDEAWEQIASNFVQARRLLEELPAGSETVSTDGQIGLATAKTQMLHAHTPPRWHSPGISVTSNIAWTLVRDAANRSLSDRRRWRSSPREP